MQLIERRHINTLKWDELVRNSKGDVFSFSWYLDSIAREWCVITDDDYTCGIAIPYTHKFGVKLAYIPVFSRYTDWFGPTDNQEIAVKIIDNSFAGYDLRLRSCLMLQNEVTIVHQNILSGRVVLGGQAKRMLNKAAKKDYIVRESLDFSFALAIIAKELTGKFKGISGINQFFVQTDVMEFQATEAQGIIKKASAGQAVWPEITYQLPSR